MIRLERLRWVLLAIAVTLVVYWLYPSRDVSESSRKIGLEAAVEPEYPAKDHPTDATSFDRADSEFEDSATCLTLEQLESHPLLAEDAYRFDSVGTHGPAIASYRGLSVPELRGLADQGDSAAMVVLGAASMMRARGQPETKAVGYLLFEEAELMTYTFKRPLTSDYLADMEQAKQWFYKAALHGRVLALYQVGDSLWIVNGGPVELGWIEQDDYDSLTTYQKSALLPANVYNLVAYEVAPQLQSGPHGALFDGLTPRSKRQQEIIDGLESRFLQDLDAAGLPPISVAESTAPPMDELMSLLCKSEQERLANEYSD